MKEQGELVNEQLEKLSIRPNRIGYSYSGYKVNGYRFHTKNSDIARKTQNNGVFVSTETSSYSSVKDRNPVRGSLGYYGVLHEVVELFYRGGNRVILFKCDWRDVTSRGGIKQDVHGFTTVNFSKKLPTNEPFILASQAQQVFYVDEIKHKDWKVVLKNQPRDLYDMGLQGDMEPDINVVQDDECATHQDMRNVVEMIDTAQIEDHLSRDDIEGVEVTDECIPNLDYNQDLSDDSDQDMTLSDDSDQDLPFSDDDNI